MCPLDAISRDRQILIEEIGGIAIVCQNPANLGGSDDHDVGLLARHPVEGRRLILQVHDIAPREQQLAILLPERSEEHTSELQSLMRISYAVFCLKKKNNQQREIKQEQLRRQKKYDVSFDEIVVKPHS